MTTAIELHRVVSVEQEQTELGTHWLVYCACGFVSAPWVNVTHSVDEYGRHAIVGAFDHAVSEMSQRHRARNRTADPVSSPASFMGRLGNALHR